MVNKENIICVESVKTKEFYAGNLVLIYRLQMLGHVNLQ